MVSQSDITYRLQGIPGHYGTNEVSQLVAGLLNLDASTISVRSLASHHFREMEKVATLNLRERPRALEKGTNEWKFRYNNLDIVFDTNFIGITPLHGILDETCDTCCIALSGLNAHAFGSFKARSDNFMWLRDALPHDLPNSRIYIYGYDTSMIDSLSRQTILDLGLQFFESLRSLVGRWSSTSPKSLLLIGHSLGGLVLEQALVNLVKNFSEHMGIIRALKGILLFGVPHLGMLNSPLLPMVQGQPNEGLVSCLKVDSDFLELQQEDFAKARSKMLNVQVIACYETVDTPTVKKDRESQQWKMIGSPALLVSKLSATKGCDVTIPINRNHSEIVKFSRQHNDYFVVANRLTELSKPYQQKHATQRPRLFEDEEKALHSLGFSEQHWRRDEINPAEDTCGWVFLNSTFNTWLDPQDRHEKMLWIAGNPGTGKSTMMKYIYNIIQQQWHGDYVLFSYFFHGRGTALQRTKLGFLRSILHQFLCCFQDSLQIFMWEYGEKVTQRAEDDIRWTEVELETILMKVIRDFQLHDSVQICLLADALDETGEQTALDIVRLFRKITAGRSNITVVFSCRRYPIVQGNCKFIAMEKDNHTDIQTVVVSLLVEEFQNDEEINILRNSILGKANGMFQWALLVTRSIVDKHRKLGNSVSALLKIIKELPSDLHELYASLLDDFGPDEKHQTIKLLRWLLFSIRPLTAEELQHALVADENYMPSSIYDFESNDHFVDPVKGIITLSRGLAEIKHHEGKKIAQFIHQSVPDYLLMGGGFGQLIGSTNRRSVVGESHFAVSRSCLNYALLPEILKFAEGKHPFYGFDSSAELFPLAQYVHDYWVVHIMHAESHSMDQKDLLGLLKTREKELCPSGVLTIPSSSSFYGSRGKRMRDIFNEDDARFKNAWGFDENEQQEKCRKYPLGFEKPWKAWERMKHDFDVHRELYTSWDDYATCSNTVKLLSLAGIRSALKSIGRQSFAKIPEERGAKKTGSSPLLLSLMSNPELSLEDIPENLTTEEVNVDPSGDYTPVYLAVLLQREELVQCFINAGADLNHICGYGKGSVLYVAAYHENKKMAGMLRDAGANMGEIGITKMEGLYSVTSCKILLDIGVTAEELFGPIDQDDYFHSWMWSNFKNFLEAGLDPNAVIKDDLTIFQAALRSDKMGVIHYSVQCPRTKPDLADAHGRTPLMQRVIWKSKVYWDNLQAHARRRDTPFKMWPDTGRLVETWDYTGRIVEVCADTGRFDLEARDHFGETLLAHATRHIRFSVVEVLLNAGVEPNVQDCNGRTPLMLAAFYGHEVNLRALLASDRTDINLVDNSEWTALCYATVNGKMVCANMLFMSSKINVEDSRYRLASVWFHCVEKGHELFLRGFADLTPQWFYHEIVEQMVLAALRLEKPHVISTLTEFGLIQ